MPAVVISTDPFHICCVSNDNTESHFVEGMREVQTYMDLQIDQSPSGSCSTTARDLCMLLLMPNI